MNKKSYGEENNLNLRVLIALSRTTLTVHRRSAEIFQKEGLTIAQFGVLEALYHKGPLMISQIIQSLLSTGGNITVVVKNLERNQLVERCVNPEDQRSSLISITEAGKKKVEQIFPEHLLDLEKSFEHLSSEDKKALLTILNKAGLK
ncbi:MAG: MarR family winged helix-turn-helix transcriptional regulator [Lachnospiraceae bacterium]